MEQIKYLISVSEAARILCLSEHTVRLLDTKGVLPAFRLANGMRVWSRGTVEELARKRGARGARGDQCYAGGAV